MSILFFRDGINDDVTTQCVVIGNKIVRGITGLRISFVVPGYSLYMGVRYRYIGVSTVI